MHESRTPLLAANWKQNHTWTSVEEFIAALKPLLPDYFPEPQAGQPEGADEDVALPLELLICAPHPYLALLGGLLDEAHIYLGAQDVSRFAGGAYTGEVSAAMLGDLGCDYCIVGHSERRWQMGEDDATLAHKLAHLAAEEIVPILCVGEQLDVRDSGGAADYTLTQLTAVKTQLEAFPELVIAYEPVWAIGTGRSASTADAQEMLQAIRGWLGRELGNSLAGQTHLLYGGSVNAENIADYLAQPDCDGALIGGASLTAAGFAALQQACLTVARSS
jgi:triosephosphate isomerase